MPLNSSDNLVAEEPPTMGTQHTSSFCVPLWNQERSLWRFWECLEFTSLGEASGTFYDIRGWWWST
jgi:hypothetical protein